MYSEEFPMERIELNIEITHHPTLIRELREIATVSDSTFETMLAGVAAYCEVAVDDYYSPEDINKLCAILTKKLREKRTLVLTLH